MENSMEKPQRFSMNSTKVYNPEWEKLSLFKGWLVNGERGALFAKCRICDRHLRAQRNDIFKHSQSTKHKTNMVKEGLINEGEEDFPDYPIKRLISPKVVKRRKIKEDLIAMSSIKADSDDGAYTIEVFNKLGNDENSTDIENIEAVEYLNEEHVIEEYDEEISEQIIDDEEEIEHIQIQNQQEQEPLQPQEQFQIESEMDESDVIFPLAFKKTPAGKPSLFSESECEIFGVFVANEMKGFRDPSKRKVFKRKILQLLLEMEDDD